MGGGYSFVNKKKVIFTFLPIILSIIVISAVTVGICVDNPKSRAATINGTPVLFKIGGVDAAVLAQLANLAEVALGAGSTADIAAIKVANAASTVPSVQLFQTVGSGDNRKISDMTYRLVYVTRAGGDIILTFYASQTYKAAKFCGSGVTTYNQDVIQTAKCNAFTINGRAEGNTTGVDIRNTLLNDFYNFLTTSFTAGGVTGKFEYVEGYIRRPAQIPWQTTGQANGIYTSTSRNINDVANLLTGDRLNDMMWLPSGPEAGFGGTSPNIWGMTSTEIPFTDASGTATFAWLRSIASSNSTATADAYARRWNGGSSSISNVTDRNIWDMGSFYVTSLGLVGGIRPAIHIAVRAYATSNIVAGFSPNSATGAGAGVTVN